MCFGIERRGLMEVLPFFKKVGFSFPFFFKSVLNIFFLLCFIRFGR